MRKRRKEKMRLRWRWSKRKEKRCKEKRCRDQRSDAESTKRLREAGNNAENIEETLKKSEKS